METATQEIIFQIITIVISLGLTVLGIYVKKFITTKIDIAKYGFDNARLERILDNAINYAEASARNYARLESAKLSSNGKFEAAKMYIDKIDPSIIAKYGKKLDQMIDRKVIQVLGK